MFGAVVGRRRRAVARLQLRELRQSRAHQRPAAAARRAGRAEPVARAGRARRARVHARADPARRSQESPPAIAAAWLLCAVGLAAAFAAWWRADATRRALIALATLFTLSLARVPRALLRRGRLHGSATSSPSRPSWRSPGPGRWWSSLARAEARVPRVARARGAGRRARARARRQRAALRARRLRTRTSRSVRWVDANVPDDVWVGARQTGTLGFFHDRTLGLDGQRGRAARAALVDVHRPPTGPARSTSCASRALAARYEVLVYDPDQNLGRARS